jgi:hypothetical protein
VTYQKLRNEEEGIIKSKGCIPRELTGFQPSSSRKLQEAEKTQGCGRLIIGSGGYNCGETELGKSGGILWLCSSCKKKSACEKEKRLPSDQTSEGVEPSPSQEAEKTQFKIGNWQDYIAGKADSEIVWRGRIKTILDEVYGEVKQMPEIQDWHVHLILGKVRDKLLGGKK